jgi:phosphoribosylglycinamide formyltransferase 1
MNQTQIKDQAPSLKIAVLVSGDGSNLQALIDAIEQQNLPGVTLSLVISNKADAYGLQRALRHKIPTAFVPWRRREEPENRLLGLLKLFEVDLIVLAGWMRIFSPDFVNQFPNRMINLHPALLPNDGSGTYTTSDGGVIPALRGLHVVQRAIDEGLKITGCTVHSVIPSVDAGPVIARAEVPILPDDNEESLQNRIKQQEHHLIVEAVRSYTQQNQYATQP